MFCFSASLLSCCSAVGIGGVANTSGFVSEESATDLLAVELDEKTGEEFVFVVEVTAEFVDVFAVVAVELVFAELDSEGKSGADLGIA